MKNPTKILGSDELISKCILVLMFGVGAISGILLLNTFHGDPTIYLVYARNIAKGNFFSFNPAQFSSGTTSPIWALILSLSFFLPESITIAKVGSMLATMLALWLSYRVFLDVSKSKVGSALGAVFVLSVLAMSGFLMYESALIIITISVLILIVNRIIQNRNVGGKVFLQDLLALALVWSVVPLVRPEAVTINALSLLVLMLLFRREKTKWVLLISVFLFSLLPAVLYFGYSYLNLGVWSVSSYCRAFALKEEAGEFLGISYSLETMKFVLAFPQILWIGFALWGSWKIRTCRSLIPLAGLAIGVFVTYIILLTFISPVTFNVARYMLPSIPFFTLLGCIGIGEFWNACKESKYVLFLLGLIFIMVLMPLIAILRQAMYEGNRGYTFDTISEKTIIQYINDTAKSDTTLLAYEVQDRYYLRPDIELLSLDGITDGKIAPYLSRGDISPFLWKYRPDYWLANDAVFYRPFLSKSVLRQVTDGTRGIEGRSVELDGIRFTCVRTRKEPVIDGFAGYRSLYKLEYNR